MAKSLDDLKAEAVKLGITLTGDESAKSLGAMIKSFVPPVPPGGVVKGPNAPVAPLAPPAAGDAKMITMSEEQFTKMIADAITRSKGEDVPQKPKRVKEHMAHVWRFDGKWVVDFVDQNIDPYVKSKIHGFNVFDDRMREWVAWLELQFQDGTTKKVPLWTYLKNRVLVYCTIVKRHQKDVSYVIGEVEKKKEEGDMMVGTGVMIDQEVVIYEETFEVKTPENEILTLPAYVIA